MLKPTTSVVRALMLTLVASALPSGLFAQSGPVITGKAAFADYTQQHPGARRKITLADLPEPQPDESVDNGPSLVPRPEGAWPIAPNGFKVEMYAQGFTEPRLMRTAPNGDIFLADSHGDKIMVLRGVGSDGKAEKISTFASGQKSGLNLPFGIAFYPTGQTRNGFTSGIPTPLCAFLTNPATWSRPAHLRRLFPSFPASPSFAAAATGPATSSLLRTGQRCSSPSALPRTPTIRTRIPTSFTARMCSSSPRRASF